MNAVLRLHVLSDLGIGLAFYCIPFAIFYCIRKRPDLPFPRIFWLFGAFILLCGTTHLLAVWGLWHANYFIEGYFKAATAIVSIATLIAIIIVLPRALGLRGPAESDAIAARLRALLADSNTERERAAQSDGRSQVALGAAVDNAVDGIITIDEHGGILSVNAACSTLFGYTQEEVMGQTLTMLMPEPYGGGNTSHGHHATPGNAKITGDSGREVQARRKDGTVFPVNLSVSPFSVDGVRYFSGFVRDITKQKQANESRDRLLLQLAAKNTELERFAYIASHDMQEPLRMVTNFAQVLILDYRDVLDDDGKEYLGIIGDAAGRMRDMVNDLLEYARLGHEGMKFAPVDTALELRHVRENLMKLIADTGATITAGELPVVFANRVELMRLLQNLIANAIKFQPAGRVPQVHVSAWRQGADWRFSVRDNGLGIDPAFIKEIFEPYRRLHSWHDIKGTGLGLAFCRKIVENHGGRIWVESSAGAGSTFFFTLPAAAQTGPSHGGIG